MPLGTLRVPAYTQNPLREPTQWNAERPGLHAHAERGHDHQSPHRSFLTLRVGMPNRTLRVPAYTPKHLRKPNQWDAERPGLHTHAERGHDHQSPHRSFLTLRVGMPLGTLRVPAYTQNHLRKPTQWDAERPGLHAHAERGHDHQSPHRSFLTLRVPAYTQNPLREPTEWDAERPGLHAYAERGAAMNNWISALADLQARGEPGILVTIIEELGSTPRNAGSKMVVSAERIHDTIGGGHLEYKAMEIAREMLASGTRQTRLERFNLGASLGQCCGGVNVLLFEPMGEPVAQIAVFGAGHVGRALVPLLASLPCRVRWIDSRENEFPESMPDGVVKIINDEPVDEVANLPAGSYCIVMTHNHQLDLELTAAILKRGDFGYFGLIGSRTKRVKFEHRLRERGFEPGLLQRMRCPMGLAEVKGKLPIEIAVSIAAEVIATYNADFGQQSANTQPIAKLLPASRRSRSS